jgi:hypothetical protein
MVLDFVGRSTSPFGNHIIEPTDAGLSAAIIRLKVLKINRNLLYINRIVNTTPDVMISMEQQSCAQKIVIEVFHIFIRLLYRVTINYIDVTAEFRRFFLDSRLYPSPMPATIIAHIRSREIVVPPVNRYRLRPS